MSQEWLDGARGCLIDSPVFPSPGEECTTVPEEHSYYTWYLIWTRRVKRVGGLVSLFVSVPRPEDYSVGAFFNYFLHLRTASLWMYLFCMRELYLCTLWAPLRPSFALKWLSGGKCFMVVENYSFLHVKSQMIVPAFQLKLLNDGSCADQRARRRPLEPRDDALCSRHTAASCLHFNYTDIIWCKCPHSPHVWGMALNLIWSKSHLI